ncbi:helix-turn-helix transcriptional regulator [Ruminococcaceae bacterium OttesenSCG-928-O06]|nr:helix-turn-helix transcriptional regulator [Ruminococcaceae bacterium OttesenSCG-928-O06]
MDFPSIVKHVREQLGMSQEEMAHALKISFATINRWENGKTHPNKMAKSVFNDFCKNHGIDMDFLYEDVERIVR